MADLLIMRHIGFLKNQLILYFGFQELMKELVGTKTSEPIVITAMQQLNLDMNM